MRVLGVDPGLERVGFGIVEKHGNHFRAIEYGLIQTPRIQLIDRLYIIHNEIIALIEKLNPDVFVTEKLVFAVNRKTAMDVSKSLGVILLAAAKKNVEWHEYLPTQIKQAVTGQGRAEKKQVEFMITKLLGLSKAPETDDVADALAIAICHHLHAKISALNSLPAREQM